MSITIGFFGTPLIASRVLNDILCNKDFSVAFVVTNPDAPVGRKHILEQTGVKKLALENAIPVFTPAKIRNNDDFLDTIKQFQVDYIVVVAYGKILPQAILSLPKKMCVNVHGSLLPAYRGASPIQSALLAGEKETGITIMQMNEKMDEGDIILTEKILIDPHETSGSLFHTFEDRAGAVVIRAVLGLESGELHLTPQDHTQATYTQKIETSDGRAQWSFDARILFQRFQAFTPFPGFYTFLDGRRILLESVHIDPEKHLPQAPGTVFRDEGGVGIVCGSGVMYPDRVKPEGKNSQSMRDFLNGQRDFLGKRLE